MPPGFFLIVKDPRCKYLTFPPCVHDSHISTSLPIILKRADGEEWEVFVRRIKDELSISRGWKMFSADMGLSSRDSLQFQPCGQNNFTITRVPYLAYQSAPLFYTILLSPEDSNLRIPQTFINMHRTKIKPFNWINVSAYNSRVWRVKIELPDNVYAFGDGWRKIVTDMNLRPNFYIVFHMISDSMFNIFAYYPNGMEVRLIKNEPHDDDDNVVSVPGDVQNSTVPDEQNVPDMPPDTDIFLFNKCVDRRLRLPIEMVRRANLDDHMMFVIRNLEGQETNMSVGIEKSGNYKRCIVRGWNSFMKDNNISAGDNCSFKFITSRRMLVITNVSR